MVNEYIFTIGREGREGGGVKKGGEEVNKVVEEVNKELVMGVVVEGVVDKEVTKVVEEVNKKLVKEVNDVLVLV